MCASLGDMQSNRIEQAYADRRIAMLAAVHRQAADYRRSLVRLAALHRRRTLAELIDPYTHKVKA